ncbi:hypothetical protein CCHL11_03025 [Colletotrichum chlorophyti]|uniref:Uncharacterized protein n=1 Tax=Colletotrichum chlorophyti TaxID=708187 RepID=A0A1Q8RG57_9PEZI|nr:hypothetical protein CCHL11_03025 [Colletotrichum chlorophyti]
MYETYVFDPICHNPFNIPDDATNTTYRDLELACVDDNIPLYGQPDATAVVDRLTYQQDGRDLHPGYDRWRTGRRDLVRQLREEPNPVLALSFCLLGARCLGIIYESAARKRRTGESFCDPSLLHGRLGNRSNDTAMMKWI